MSDVKYNVGDDVMFSDEFMAKSEIERHGFSMNKIYTISGANHQNRFNKLQYTVVDKNSPENYNGTINIDPMYLMSLKELRLKKIKKLTGK